MTNDEYLNLVMQVVHRNTPKGGHLTAAALGALLRQTGEPSWTNFGFRTLSDVLRRLDDAHRLKTTKTPKDALAVEPLEPATDAPGTASAAALRTFNPLNKAVWDAFVFASPVGRRFMHRVSGSVRAGLDATPEPADEWVEITRIPVDTQKQWARDFLSEQTGKFPAAAATLGNPTWYPHEFYTALREEDESTARQWHRFRSSHVSEQVQNWAIENKLEFDAVFDRRDRTRSAALTKGVVLESTGEHLPDHAREVVLLALSQMSTERLMEVPIPAGLLFAALSKIRAR